VIEGTVIDERGLKGKDYNSSEEWYGNKTAHEDTLKR
jgi:hypothetical protein